MTHRSTSPAALARHLLDTAHEQGFDLAAILPVPLPGSVAGETHTSPGALTSPRAASHYLAWLEQGFHGEMAYLSRPDAVYTRLHPEGLLPGLRSILVVGLNYHVAPLPQAPADDPGRGLIAGYAVGDDYHAVLKTKLAALVRSLETVTGRAIANRAFVDTSPVLERDVAAQAGLGFLGKNTCLINPRVGSWLLLGGLLLAAELPPASMLPSSPAGVEGMSPLSCGRCSRCIQACPSGALVAPYILDARRCISYLTIELKGPVPRELRPLLGNHIFGCDVCQQVCPWNKRFARPAAEPVLTPHPVWAAPRLADLLALDEAAFARLFRSSSLKRAKRRGLLRNAAIAMGNWGSMEAVPPLVHALHDAEPLVRGHAAWALGRIGTGGSHRALAAALPVETDPWTKTEISMALEGR